jgi:heme-degrading monooxygenase HmoA
MASSGAIGRKPGSFPSANEAHQHMLAVIFEVWPKTDRKQEYLDIATELRPLLEATDGFISIERFESLYESGKILSLSFFRDEAAVQRWRNALEHRAAQTKGRRELFADYRLRIAGVVRDYGMNNRSGVPKDSLAAHCDPVILRASLVI